MSQSNWVRRFWLFRCTSVSCDHAQWPGMPAFFLLFIERLWVCVCVQLCVCPGRGWDERGQTLPSPQLYSAAWQTRRSSVAHCHNIRPFICPDITGGFVCVSKREKESQPESVCHSPRQPCVLCVMLNCTRGPVGDGQTMRLGMWRFSPLQMTSLGETWCRASGFLAFRPYFSLCLFWGERKKLRLILQLFVLFVHNECFVM